MKITDMIMEWRKGCSCCDKKPIECNYCTSTLIRAIDEKAFKDEGQAKYTEIINEHGVFGIPIAASHFAQLISHRQTTIRAINEQTNKKD